MRRMALLLALALSLPIVINADVVMEEKIVSQSYMGVSFVGGTEVTYLVLESGLNAICSKGVSAAALYIDVASAVAEIATCLVIRDSSSKVGLISAAVEAGFCHDFAVEVADDMSNLCVWHEAEASSHLEEVALEGLRRQVGSFEGRAGACRMTRGTRAGKLFADLMSASIC